MLGDQIRQARERRNLSQEEAARLAGVSRKQFWKLETGRGVTLETFRRAVTALEMPVVTLGAVKVYPAGAADSGELLDNAKKALQSLQSLVDILEAAPPSRDVTSDEALAAAAAAANGSSPITEDHPTVRMLHELVDKLAAARPARTKP